MEGISRKAVKFVATVVSLLKGGADQEHTKQVEDSFVHFGSLEDLWRSETSEQ